MMRVMKYEENDVSLQRQRRPAHLIYHIAERDAHLCVSPELVTFQRFAPGTAYAL